MNRKYFLSFLFCSAIISCFAADEDINWYAPGPVRQNCFTHCKVDFAPGKKYLTEKREWQGCPTILRTPKGTLYAGWYSGGPGEGLLNYSLMVKSSDNGMTWSKEPLLVIDSLTEQKIQSLDIQFWLDPQGRFWYFWTQRDYNYPQKHPKHLSVWAIICDDPDAQELKWSKPRFISPGFLRCQPTVLKDGRWILCAYDWLDDHYRYSESSDNGNSWYRRVAGKKYTTNAFDETMMFESGDGTLRLLARSSKKVGYLVECRSHDGGRTWSDGVLSDIPNPSSRFFIKRLRSGNILMLNNWNKDDRYDLTAAISVDDGKTWKHKLLLDHRRATYPDAVEGDDGELFIVHDFSRGGAKEILISRLTERDIIEGLQKNALVDTDSYLQHIINKAPGLAKLTSEEKTLSDKFRPKNHKNALVVIDIQGIDGNICKDVSAGKGASVSMRSKDRDFQIRSRNNAGKDWEDFAFSFVASRDRVIISLRAGGWVDYDDIKVENGKLYNPSFEIVNSDREVDGWRYYAEETAKIGQRNAADGSVFMTCGSRVAARQVLHVEPGKKVTVKLKVRKGSRIILPNTPWVSSGRRKVN